MKTERETAGISVIRGERLAFALKNMDEARESLRAQTIKHKAYNDALEEHQRTKMPIKYGPHHFPR